MTEAERQQVIDALEASLGHLRKVEAEYMTADGQFAAEYAQLNEALAIMRMESACKYPECVDNGPDGKCTAWLIGDCEGPKHG